jgi:hypothetical protein
MIQFTIEIRVIGTKPIPGRKRAHLPRLLHQSGRQTLTFTQGYQLPYLGPFAVSREVIVIYIQAQTELVQIVHTEALD